MPVDLRWGVLGTAAISATVIESIERSRAGTVTAIASRSIGRARDWAARFGVPDAFGSYDDMLGSGRVDVVYVPLPNSMHAHWTTRALKAGLPVLCEKPLAACADEARRVAEVSSRTGLYVLEGFMYRFHPLWERVRDVIEEGTLGVLSTIDATFTFLLDDPRSIVASPDLAGGALMDVGCYPVNLSRWIAAAEPDRVAAFERRSAVDRTMVGLLDFPNGILGRFETSIESAERHRVEISGTRASLVVDDPWVPGRVDTFFRIRRRGEPDRVVEVAGADAYAAQAEHFADVVTGRSEPRWSLDDSIANMAVLDALTLAAGKGRVVEPARLR